MRVAFLGAANSVHTLRWVSSLVGAGVEVTVFSIHDALPALSAVCKVIRLPFNAPVGYLAAAPRFMLYCIKEQFDVIHVNYASGYGTLALVALRTNYVLSVWGSDVLEFPWRSIIHKWWLQLILSRASIVVSSSQTMADSLTTLGLPTQKIRIVPFGVETELFRFERMGQLPNKSITIGVVKGVDHVYGTDVLLRAWQIATRDSPDILGTLQIVGTGPKMREYQRLCEKLGLSGRVCFVGAIAHAEVPKWLQKFDIFVMPSRRESFGVAALEAAAAGLPVIASDTGGLREVVKDGVTGILVPPEDPQALANAILMLAKNQQIRKKMGQAGMALVRLNYEWSHCVGDLLSIYVSNSLKKGYVADASGK